MLKLFARKPADAKAELKAVFDGYTLPTFPTVYLEALQLVRDTDASAGALADVLASDPGLTMRLLGTVNSAAFGLRSPIKSVHHAVSMLGRGHIESMLISLASHSSLPSAPCDGFEPERSECFTAALLSDMAVPVLCTRKGAPYTQVLQGWHEGQGELQEMERATFGWDHAQVAALMCDDWGFPTVIAEAIAAHHGSDDADVHELPPVNLAALIPEINGERGVAAVAEHAHDSMGMDTDEVRALVETSFLQAEEIAQQFAA